MHIDSLPPAMTTPTKFKYVCDECGSEDVKCDAWAAWDVEAQDWVLDNTFDEAFCPLCDGQCGITKTPVNEP